MAEEDAGPDVAGLHRRGDTPRFWVIGLAWTDTSFDLTA